MVFLTEKPRRTEPACCKVEVINGAVGKLRAGFSSFAATVKVALDNAETAVSAWSLMVGLYASPLKRMTCARIAAGVARSANTSQYSSGTNLRISASRSAIKRTATDCTRPADKPRATFAHNSGLTMKPTTRSRKRRACWALTPFMSSSPQCWNAS